jgi:cytochrome bd-type quinol oxidase subunit 2
MNANPTAAILTTFPAERVPMSSLRKTALVTGVLYIITFVSVPTLVLYGSIHNSNYVVGNGSDMATIAGGILEIIVALAGIGTAVVLYPVLRKQNEGMALGLVAFRTLEAGTMFVGVAFLLSVVVLRQAGAGANALVTSHALVALYDRIFLLGQSFMPALDDLLLGLLLYRSRLVPRSLSLIGIIGAVPLVIGYIAVLFGLIGQHSALAGLSAVPVAAFEFSLGIYLVVKGFNPDRKLPD